MKISGQLTWQDYLKATYLHLRPNRWMQIVLYALVALFLLSLLSLVVLAVFFEADVSGVWSIILVVLIVVAAVLLNLFVLTPWRVRRLFAQHKEISAPMELEITPTGLGMTTAYGNSNRPWGIFRKWKESRELLMLYITDIQFLMIPKRFCTAEQIEALRTHLQENNIADASRSFRGYLFTLAIFLVIVVLAAALYYLIYLLGSMH